MLRHCEHVHRDDDGDGDTKTQYAIPESVRTSIYNVGNKAICLSFYPGEKEW